MKHLDLKQEYDNIFQFWELMELFAPKDYPDLKKKVKENKTFVPLDVCHVWEADADTIPFRNYISHNEYLAQKGVKAEEQYDKVNLYCGSYKLNKFMTRMAELCNLDQENIAELGKMDERFYIFSAQVDLNGCLTEEGVQVSPFFYTIISIMKARNLTVHISEEDLLELNADINELLKQKDIKFSQFSDLNYVKAILFEKLNIPSEESVSLERASRNMFACKGLRAEEDSLELQSFFLDEIRRVKRDYANNQNIIKYVGTLLHKSNNKVMIDSDINAMRKWLEVDRYPMAKYPSVFSPTLMQQIAINITISEKDRNENIFSVNGPPGTGKTTLLKELIASNVQKQAEALIKYGMNPGLYIKKTIPSTTTSTYTDFYYELPYEITKYEMIVVSNNNGAVENISMELPKAEEVKVEKTRTELFDRERNEEIYFSKCADQFLTASAWGMISARMGRKSNVNEVLETCRFRKEGENENAITLDTAKESCFSWEEAIENYRKCEKKVLKFRQDIRNDQKILENMYEQKEMLRCAERKLLEYQETFHKQKDILKKAELQINRNEEATRLLEDEIIYIKAHASLIERILIFLSLGTVGRRVKEKRVKICDFITEHEELIRNANKQEVLLRKQEEKLLAQENLVKENIERVRILEEKVYGEKDSLKEKYGANLADRDFFADIKHSKKSQNACPWTFAAYDEAREELFYAALQVRKSFVLNTKYVRRNLFCYQKYVHGKFTPAERKEMFPHLLHALMLVVPVVSSTFASVRTFLKDAGNQSIGYLIIDEAGQGTPQAALGSIYRAQNVIAVGDPLQIEPVVTIPQAVIRILAEGTHVAMPYQKPELSVQVMCDRVNEFNGKIGENVVGCPLLVHRRCIEPMFSISNRISYDNRMFNETKEKEQDYIIEQSGWINVEGEENTAKDHFVEAQAEVVCRLLEKGVAVYADMFESRKNVFIISPFKSVASGMRKYIINHFKKLGVDKDVLEAWVKDSVGTVHTFQGKDANEVFFVLGCSSKSEGAMNWVVHKPNILNVACTRAKYRIAFIGKYDDWKNRACFREFVPELIEKGASPNACEG